MSEQLLKQAERAIEAKKEKLQKAITGTPTFPEIVDLITEIFYSVKEQLLDEIDDIFSVLGEKERLNFTLGLKGQINRTFIPETLAPLEEEGKFTHEQVLEIIHRPSFVDLMEQALKNQDASKVEEIVSRLDFQYRSNDQLIPTNAFRDSELLFNMIIKNTELNNIISETDIDAAKNMLTSATMLLHIQRLYLEARNADTTGVFKKAVKVGNRVNALKDAKAAA